MSNINYINQNFKSEALSILNSRGFLKQCTDLSSLDQILSEQSVTFYIGFDCTAPSLHIGSLIPIMCVRLLQKFGHKPIIILGGGTSKVGDPSGKDTERTLLSNTEIENYADLISKIFYNFLDFNEKPNKAVILNNALWLDQLKYIDFLREYGKYFSINHMLSFDSIKTRLEKQQSISFLEFNYMLMQAYDFITLNNQYNCILQLGGSDQWGNIINGIELAKKIRVNNILYGLTVPLLTTSSGKKIGKTSGGKIIWLNSEYTSPYDYWQYFRNIDDQDLITFLKLFTELPLSDINNINTSNTKDINNQKIKLANEVTKLCHGEKELELISKKVAFLFSKNEFIDNYEGDEDIYYNISLNNVKAIGLASLLKELNLVKSTKEGRRLIESNAVSLNGKVIHDAWYKISYEEFCDNDKLIILIGKKRRLAVKLMKH